MTPRQFPVEIRCPDFALTPAIRQYAMDHLAAKLLKHARRILSAVVRFEDSNGPRRGEDKVCRVEVLIPRHGPVVVEEVHHDLRAAIDIAADRLETTVTRDLQRLRAEPLHRGRRLARTFKSLR